MILLTVTLLLTESYILGDLMLRKVFVIACMLLISLPSLFASGNGETSTNTNSKKIGIVKLVQHDALDDVEQGIIDVINESGFDVMYNLQNANGDVNTSAQIANMYKVEDVDVAVGIATAVAISLANTFKDTPVVFGTVTDPIGAGLVSSLEKGEGNITGMSNALPISQHIELFLEIANIQKLGYIYTSTEQNSLYSLSLVEKACKEMGIELISQSITNSSEVKQAAEAIVNRVDGLYLTTDNIVFSALPSVIQVFEKAKKPVFSGDVTGALNGGCVMASGFNYYKAGRATGEIVVQILNGTKPQDIPIRFMTEPSDSDFLVNLDAAKNAGITIAEKYIEQAGYIIENGNLTEKEQNYY